MAKIQIRRDSSANWNKSSAGALAYGEFACSYDSTEQKHTIKMGKASSGSNWVTSLEMLSVDSDANKLGHGFVVCDTAAIDTVKKVTVANWLLQAGNILVVEFENGYTTSMTSAMWLEVNGTSKQVYYGSSVVNSSGIINAGDTATLVYTGTAFSILSIDRLVGNTDLIFKKDKKISLPASYSVSNFPFEILSSASSSTKGVLNLGVSSKYVTIDNNGNVEIPGTLKISSNTAATQTWVSSNYLPLTGGTLTGNAVFSYGKGLNFNNSLGVNPISVYRGSNGVQIEGDASIGNSAGATSTLLVYGYLHTLNNVTIDENCTIDGDLVVNGSYPSSDIRRKDVVEENCLPTIEQITQAPAIKFTWKDRDDKRLHVGSTAQYWQEVMPELVKESENGMLGMDYGAAGLLSAISVAKVVKQLESRIVELEQEIAKLKGE